MKIILIIILLIFSGCNASTSDREVIDKDSNNTTLNTKEEEYTDDNPIKLGIYLVDNNYRNKKSLSEEYITDFIKREDVGSFEVFYSPDVVDGIKFRDTWDKYYNNYSDIDKYKIGYYIKLELEDGTQLEHTFLAPDIFIFGEYCFIYFYDDVHQADGAFYSHLETMEDNTIMSSVKIWATDGIDKVGSIILKAFTYDSDDFDSDGNYRGNSFSTVRIVKR